MVHFPGASWSDIISTGTDAVCGFELQCWLGAACLCASQRHNKQPAHTTACSTCFSDMIL